MEKQISGKTIRLVQADITTRKVDAIINAANSYLQHGGGVAAAISKKGGPTIQQESNMIDFVPVGSAVVTTAGNLACKGVIHAVGPRMGQGDEEVKLKSTVQSIMRLATQKNYSSISIPAISSGIFGFPKDRCAKIRVQESKYFVQENDTPLQLVEFCIYDDETYGFFENELNRLF